MERYFYKNCGLLTSYGMNHCPWIFLQQVIQLLTDISSVKVSRFVGNVSKGDSRLLIFCDASIKAYATTLYLRVNDGIKFQVNLLFSKMRLVPVTKKEEFKRHNYTSFGTASCIDWC